MKEAGQAQVADADLARRSDHDVGGLQVAMEDPVGVQVLAAIEQLEHDGLDGGGGDGVTGLLGVVVDDLEEVVFGVLEDHEDALVLEDDLDQLDDVLVVELGAQSHLADGRLGDARVGDLLPLLIGLELLDSELAGSAMAAQGLVHSAIRPTTNEAYNFVSVGDSHTAPIADRAGGSVGGVYVMRKKQAADMVSRCSSSPISRCVLRAGKSAGRKGGIGDERERVAEQENA